MIGWAEQRKSLDVYIEGVGKMSVQHGAKYYFHSVGNEMSMFLVEPLTDVGKPL